MSRFVVTAFAGLALIAAVSAQTAAAAHGDADVSARTFAGNALGGKKRSADEDDSPAVKRGGGADGKVRPKAGGGDGAGRSEALESMRERIRQRRENARARRNGMKRDVPAGETVGVGRSLSKVTPEDNYSKGRAGGSTDSSSSRGRSSVDRSVGSGSGSSFSRNVRVGGGGGAEDDDVPPKRKAPAKIDDDDEAVAKTNSRNKKLGEKPDLDSSENSVAAVAAALNNPPPPKKDVDDDE